MVQWLAFGVLSLPILYVSRACILRLGSHGFYRFFAWEAILGLGCLNLMVWFDNCLAWHQIISWFLLWVSVVPLYFGVRSLAKKGAAVAHRAEDESLFPFEKTTVLVTTGIYGYIRHPLYASLLYLAWGVFWKLPSFVGFGLAGVATLALFLTARADERECVRYFGQEYEDYMKRTKRFLPFGF